MAESVNPKMMVGIVAGVIGAMVGMQSVRGVFSNPEAELQKVAQEMNQRLPMAVDAETRLDTTFAGPGKVLTYNYTLVNLSSDAIDATALKAQVAPDLQNRARTGDTLIKKGVTLRYRYSDKAGKFLFEVTVDP